MSSKYIGQVKDVNGFTLTVIDVEKQRFMVEITQDGTDFTEVEVVSRGAWIRGVFSKIMKRLKPAYIGETKKINDVLFRIVEVAKNKFKIIADGFDGVHVGNVRHNAAVLRTANLCLRQVTLSASHPCLHRLFRCLHVCDRCVIRLLILCEK